MVNELRQTLRPGKIRFHHLYRKQLGDKAMVLKFTGWETNKERTGQWPAYMLHVTDFSSQQAERCQHEVDINDDRRQFD